MTMAGHLIGKTQDSIVVLAVLSSRHITVTGFLGVQGKLFKPAL